MEFLKELFQFLLHRKRYWLIPLGVILMILSLMIVISGSSALSPFIYSLF